MEIKDNEYIRTFSGGILTKKDLDNLLRFTNCKTDEIVKSHAKRVSELIEIGDYVNGRKVKKITLKKNDYNDKNYPLAFGGLTIRFEFYDGDYINDYEIVSILTHEMYDNNVFVVEDRLEWTEM